MIIYILKGYGKKDTTSVVLQLEMGFHWESGSAILELPYVDPRLGQISKYIVNHGPSFLPAERSQIGKGKREMSLCCWMGVGGSCVSSCF